MKSMLSGFREFIVRGNAIDLAVGVVVGAAFSAVVKSIVEGILNPLIAAIFGKPDLSGLWNITLRTFDEGPDAVLSFGMVLNALLQFVLVAAAIYFVIVLPMNTLAAHRARLKAAGAPEVEKATVVSDEVAALHEIRDLLAERATGPSGPHRH